MRIVLVHALNHSAAAIEGAFEALWPAAERVHLLDDSLARDLARSGHLSQSFHDRFLVLGRYGLTIGADAILFTCSAFGPCIEAVRSDLSPLPVRRPNEAMIQEATAHGGRWALVASFAPTLRSMLPEFPKGFHIVPIHAAGALEALDRGDAELHDQLVADAAAGSDVDGVILAQFSLARAADAVRSATGLPVLTTPEAAVRELKHTLQGSVY